MISGWWWGFSAIPVGQCRSGALPPARSSAVILQPGSMKNGGCRHDTPCLAPEGGAAREPAASREARERAQLSTPVRCGSLTGSNSVVATAFEYGSKHGALKCEAGRMPPAGPGSPIKAGSRPGKAGGCTFFVWAEGRGRTDCMGDCRRGQAGRCDPLLPLSMSRWPRTGAVGNDDASDVAFQDTALVISTFWSVALPRSFR